MASLSGSKIKNTYQSLLKFSDNGNITTGAKQLTDGFGNTSPVWVSTTQVGIGVTPESGLNLHVYGDAKIGSNLTVIGNLVVEGSTTTVGTDTLTVKDPLIVLASDNTSTDAVDIGFYGKYTPSGTVLYSGMFREALTGKYRLFKSLQVEPTTTVNTSGTGYAVATLIASLEGNADTASGVLITKTVEDLSYRMIFTTNNDDTETNGQIYKDTAANFYYNPSTNSLTVATIYAGLSGNVTGGTISGTTGDFSDDVTISSASDKSFIVNNTESSARYGLAIQYAGTARAVFDFVPDSGIIRIGGITTADEYPVIYSDGVASLTFGLGTTPSATFVGNILLGGTVDGRDIATDGTKLDGIEAGADITDTTNVTAAGALMDSELTNLAAVKAINQQLTTASSVEFNSITGDVTGNADTATKIDSITNSNIVQLTDTQTLTNKSIDADDNTITDLVVGNLKSGVLDTDLTSVSASDDTIASAKAIKSYVDTQITAEDLDIAGDSGTGAVDLNSQTFTITGGSNVTTSVSGQTVTINSTGSIDGGGTANDVVMWLDSNTLTDAPIAISGNNATFAGDVGIGVTPTTELTVQGTARIQTNATFYSDRTYLGDAYTFGSGETGDGVTYTINGAQAGTTGNYFRWLTQAGAATPVERMRITNGGNVGIGTDSPPSDHKLQIHNAAAYARFALTNSSTGVASADGLIFQMEGLNSIIKNQEAGYLTFGTSGRETDLYIDSAGNVGINTTSPSCILNIEDSVASTAPATDSNNLLLIENTNVAGSCNIRLRGGDGATRIMYGHNVTGEDKLYITPRANDNPVVFDGSGNVGIGTDSPVSKLSIDSNGIPIFAAAAMATTGLTIHNSTGGTAIQIGTYDAGSYNYIQSSYVNSASTARELRFYNGSINSLKLDTSGDANFAGKINAVERILTEATTSNALLQVKYNASNYLEAYYDKLNVVGGSFLIQTAGTTALTLDSSQKATFASEISAGDDINTTGKLFVSKTAAELRLKTTNNSTGTSLINFGDADDSDIGQILYAHSDNSMAFTVNASQQMTIDSSGKVGIGTTVAPFQKLTITGASGAADGLLENGILALTTGTGVIADTRLLFGIVNDDYGWIQAGDYGVAYRDIALNPNGGNVGIGETSPSSLLHIKKSNDAFQALIIEGGVSTNAAGSRFQNGSGSLYMFVDNSAGDYGPTNGTGAASAYAGNFRLTGAYPMQFATSDTLRMTIAAGGDVTCTGDIIAYSDKKLKKNIKTLDGSKVYKMRGVSFDRVDTGEAGSGVIAQEMQKIAPELISESNETLGVAYGNISGYLIEAIKELKQEIEELKSKQCNCKSK